MSKAKMTFVVLCVIAVLSVGADGFYLFNVPYLPDDVRSFIYRGGLIGASSGNSFLQ